MRRMIIVFVLTMTLGCAEWGVQTTNIPPTAAITYPVDGDVFDVGELIEFTGVTSDSGAETDLTVTWSTSNGGPLGEEAPDANGAVYLAIADLAEGDHTVTLTVVDTGSLSGSDSVQILVGEDPGDDDDAEDGSPTVLIQGPAGGSEFLRDEEINFIATVADGQQSPDTLGTTFVSTVDGVFWEGFPSVSGTVDYTTGELQVGTHSVTLTAVDDDGHLGSDAVDFEILNDGRPFVWITNPANGSGFYNYDTINFEGTVADDESDVEVLVVTWSSSIDGELWSGNPDSNGYTVWPQMLTAGSHVITLTALDEDLQEASENILVDVLDPNDFDNDGDGYTPNQGDCDDNDALVNPGMTDVCDDIDNDCNGLINDPMADIYEYEPLNLTWSPNDTYDTGWDLGEVDDPLWNNDTIEVSGLSLHNDADEDWFTWFADDEYYDNVSIAITVDIPYSGTYVVELYQVDNGNWSNWGSWNLEDSASGGGFLQVTYGGDMFDDDEDYFAIRVHSMSWDITACNLTYDFYIVS